MFIGIVIDSDFEWNSHINLLFPELITLIDSLSCVHGLFEPMGVLKSSTVRPTESSEIQLPQSPSREIS